MSVSFVSFGVGGAAAVWRLVAWRPVAERLAAKAAFVGVEKKVENKSSFVETSDEMVVAMEVPVIRRSQPGPLGFAASACPAPDCIAARLQQL